MKSKFLYQDVDVVFLADKGIVVRCFVCRDYDKVLMETGKLCDNIRVTKNGLVSGVDRMFKSSDSAFKHITDRLNPLRKSGRVRHLLSSPTVWRIYFIYLSFIWKYEDVLSFVCSILKSKFWLISNTILALSHFRKHSRRWWASSQCFGRTFNFTPSVMICVAILFSIWAVPWQNLQLGQNC